MNPSDIPPPEVRLLAALTRPRIGESEAEAARTALAAGPDPGRLLVLADRNRLVPLLWRALKAAGLDAALPEALGRELRDRLRRELFRAARLDEATRDLLVRFHANGARAVLLRGPAVGERVYDDPSLRPYSDLDLLIDRGELPRVKALLREAGYGPPAGALDDGYYERQHLHLLYVHGKTGVMAEVHWALDHRFTRWLIDYAEILDAARPGTIAGAPALRLAEDDLLLSLCIHLVKHGPWIERLLERPDAAARVLAAGWWIHALDVAAALDRLGGTLDVDRLVAKAQRWNVEPAARAGLRATEVLLGVPPPAGVLARLDGPEAGPLARRLEAAAVRWLSGDPDAPRRSRFGFRRDTGFRPVRLLDAFRYLWPDTRTLRRRYPHRGRLARRWRHAAGAFARLAGGAVDLARSRLHQPRGRTAPSAPARS